MMKVAGISSSAGKDGNISILTNTIFEELHKENIETELIQLAGTMIEQCKACWEAAEKETVFMEMICSGRYLKRYCIPTELYLVHCIFSQRFWKAMIFLEQ